MIVWITRINARDSSDQSPCNDLSLGVWRGNKSCKTFTEKVRVQFSLGGEIGISKENKRKSIFQEEGKPLSRHESGSLQNNVRGGTWSGGGIGTKTGQAAGIIQWGVLGHMSGAVLNELELVLSRIRKLEVGDFSLPHKGSQTSQEN